MLLRKLRMPRSGSNSRRRRVEKKIAKVFDTLTDDVGKELLELAETRRRRRKARRRAMRRAQGDADQRSA